MAEYKLYSHAQSPPDPALFPGQLQPDTFAFTLHHFFTKEFYRSCSARRFTNDAAGAPAAAFRILLTIILSACFRVLSLCPRGVPINSETTGGRNV
jgi:hypothetical protein